MSCLAAGWSTTGSPVTPVGQGQRRDADSGQPLGATLGSPHEYVHYAAAKAAVEALTIGLAKELASDQIRVSAVAPGTIRTAIHAAAGDPGRPDRVARNIPLGRAGQPARLPPPSPGCSARKPHT
ncbi:MAG: SDR family oxidoreductase [Streptosporangiaceae bacterium]